MWEGSVCLRAFCFTIVSHWYLCDLDIVTTCVWVYSSPSFSFFHSSIISRVYCKWFARWSVRVDEPDSGCVLERVRRRARTLSTWSRRGVHYSASRRKISTLWWRNGQPNFFKPNSKTSNLPWSNFNSLVPTVWFRRNSSGVTKTEP